MKKCSPLNIFFWKTLWSIQVGYHSIPFWRLSCTNRIKTQAQLLASWLARHPPPRSPSGAPRPEFIHLDSSYCNCVIRAITNIAVGPAPPSTHSGRYNRHYKRQKFSPLVSLNEGFLLSSLDHNFGSTYSWVPLVEERNFPIQNPRPVLSNGWVPEDFHWLGPSKYHFIQMSFFNAFTLIRLTRNTFVSLLMVCQIKVLRRWSDTSAVLKRVNGKNAWSFILCSPTRNNFEQNHSM